MNFLMQSLKKLSILIKNFFSFLLEKIKSLFKKKYKFTLKIVKDYYNTNNTKSYCSDSRQKKESREKYFKKKRPKPLDLTLIKNSTQQY